MTGLRLAGVIALLCAACGAHDPSPVTPGTCVSEADLAPSATFEQRSEAETLFRDGLAEVALCHYDAGIAKLGEAIKLAPSPNEIYQLGRAYLEYGNRPIAIHYFHKYLATSPCDRATVAPMLAKLEEDEAARPTPIPTRGDLRACARRLFGEGMSEIEAKRYEAGILKLKQANDAVPGGHVLFNISRAYQEEGDLPRALEYLRKYEQTNPPDRAQIDDEIRDLERRVRERASH